MALRKDEYGFVRSNGFGRARHADIRSELGAESGDQLYQSTIRKGARTSIPVSGENISYQPGDTFALGPKVTKASIPAKLTAEWQALQRGGYGQIGSPVETAWGFVVELSSFLLPGGVRTRAMVLLPKDYPVTPPLGFYIHESGLDAVRSQGIDVRHLFPDKTYYGAPNLAQKGWAWFCLKFEPWRPGRHSLIGIVMMVAAVMAEGANK